jgi:starch synthase
MEEIGSQLIRADQIQNLYLAGLKLRVSAAVTDELAYWSKRWLDRLSEAPARESDIFLFYSGAGLRSATRLRGSGVRRVVEAVNSHVLVQERILREEYQRIGRPFRRFHPREVARRLQEYETADALLCPSDFVRQSFEDQGFPADRIFKVPYGMTLPLAAAAPAVDDGTFRVLYVGQISVRKGLRYLFQAFAALRHPRKELWIVGPKTGETGVHDLAPPEGTRFLGVLKGEALAQAYQSSTVFVLPTIEDGLGLVLGEALSYGLPVIATDHSGGTDLFRDGEEGFIVPIRASAAIGNRLQGLADDRSLRERMAAAAQARAQSLGGWATTGKLLVATLAEMARLPQR